MLCRGSLYCSNWFWLWTLLILGTFVGSIGMHRLCAADPVATDVKRLDGNVISIDFINRGKDKPSELVACDKDGLVKVYDVVGKELRRWRVGGGLIAISSEADAYAVVTSPGRLFFGRLSTPEKLTRVGPDGDYSQVRFSRDGKWVAAPGISLVQIWQTAGWVECRHENWSGDHVHERLAFIDDGGESSFVTAGYGTTGEIERWSLPGGEKLQDYRGDPEVDRKFIDLVTSPDSRWLVGVTCASDNLVVWDVRSGEIVARPNASAKKYGCLGHQLAFSGDGKILVSSHRHYLAGFRLFQVDGWKELGHFGSKETVNTPVSAKEAAEFEKLGVYDVAVDFTGSNVATRHGDGHVRLWNVTSALKKSQE